MKITIDNHGIMSDKRKGIFKTLVLAVIVMCTLFGILNISYGAIVIACMELFIAFVSLLLYSYIIRMQDDRNLVTISTLFISLTGCLLVPVALHPEMSVTNFLWFFIIPSASYALTGTKIGFRLSLIFSTICIVCYQISGHTSNTDTNTSLYNMIGCLLVNWYIVHIYETSNLKVMKNLEILSSTDELTQLYNRKILKTIYDSYSCKGVCLTYIVIDIDFFKKVNDDYGHDTGDAVLVFFANHLQTHFKDYGYLIRMGGEEFCIVLPAVAKEDAQQLCEDCLKSLGNRYCSYENYQIALQFSAGISACPDDGQSYSELLKVADKRLYHAKKIGRNRIVSQ